MKASQAIIVLAFTATSASAKVVSLNPDNIDTVAAGKSVFIKFFAPWCGHCKAIASDWEDLAEEFDDDEHALIAEVDCTEEDGGQELCQEYGVQGYPSLKYGTIGALEDYEGERDYAAISSFAQENLKPSCSALNIDLCDAAQKENIEAKMTLSTEELKKLIDDVEDKLEEAEEKFNDGVEQLQNKYEELMQEFEDEQDEFKEKNDYKVMKAILAFKKKMSAKGDHEEL